MAKLTWADDIKDYFTQLEIGCMRGAPIDPPAIDLGDYDSVRTNAARIYEAVKSGSMPKGGPLWPQHKTDNFKAWMHGGYPKTQSD